MKWKWFRRKPKQTPEETYIEELNKNAERRESQPPSPHIPQLDQYIMGNEITADMINASSITIDKITDPFLIPDEIRATSIDHGRING